MEPDGNQHAPRRRSRRGSVVALALMTTLAFAGTALAVPQTINDVDLNAGGGAVFDPYNDDYGCTDGTSGSSAGFYSPVEDGSLDGQSDAFDAGLILYVGDNGFRDPDGMGNWNAGTNQLTVGPKRVSGFVIKRIDRALPGSRTLRSLIQIKNPSNRTRTRYLTLDTEYGSDSSTVIEATSSGNMRFNSKDRWGITSDDSFSDPVVTLVNYGKGQVLKPVLQIGPYPDLGNDGADCVLDVFHVTLGPRETGYLMFFVELSADDTDAIASVGKFNRQRLNSALLNGIRSKARGKIMNWDLT